MLEAISTELEKVRAGRAEAMERVYPSKIQSQLDSAAWKQLRRETVHGFDASRFPLLEAFASAIGVGAATLNQLHTKFNGDQGSKSDRREKASMLAGLRDPALRQPLLDAYERLVLEQLAPLVAEAMDCNRVVFQSFPCVRVLRPGEFSIGPHCDSQVTSYHKSALSARARGVWSSSDHGVYCVSFVLEPSWCFHYHRAEKRAKS